MKHVALCADDYAIAPGVSLAIRQLVAGRCINATSVMTVFDGLAEEAAALKAAAEGTGASLGLHVTLTGTFAPLTSGMAGPAGTFPALSPLLLAAMTRRLDPKAVAAEVEAQFLAFAAAFGHPPHHVDGHQHVHVLPVVRAAVLKATARHAPQAWLRDVTPARGALHGFDLKGRVIGTFATGFARAAAQLGLSTNRGFGGAYDFSADHDFATLLAHFLKGVPDGGLVMVHPGRVDDPLTARDPLTHQREVEYEVLHGPLLREILDAADVSLTLPPALRPRPAA
ncbi:ChbG/HpnK family deacetylase [Xanthobacter dioxanivorans]|uniref:ChbG/HpnK family deacetylase n=1 Tax=Xanthobacter dioxanivorans TaxID=2528964 RepID=A0A974PQE7_9HYPH|nr:ChbG/HpnK family deacetylase [Xanthobacter dioxanivorans]QRG07459.1 ChbG/HpnK family deacetylase [Xanthobacter dioxanivorans]